MRRLFAASALLTMLGATPGMAESYAWCVLNPGNVSPECRFTSYEQCRATAAGIGDCSRNPGYIESQVPAVDTRQVSPAPNSLPPVTGNANGRKRTN
jgi:hypothetical protein